MTIVRVRRWLALFARGRAEAQQTAASSSLSTMSGVSWVGSCVHHRCTALRSISMSLRTPGALLDLCPLSMCLRCGLSSLGTLKDFRRATPPLIPCAALSATRPNRGDSHQEVAFGGQHENDCKKAISAILMEKSQNKKPGWWSIRVKKT